MAINGQIQMPKTYIKFLLKDNALWGSLLDDWALPLKLPQCPTLNALPCAFSMESTTLPLK